MNQLYQHIFLRQLVLLYQHVSQQVDPAVPCFALADCTCRRDGRGLGALLRELSGLPGLRWLRLLYCYPSYFDDDLIQEIATNPKVASV